MSEKIIAINRLTGRQYGENSDDSNANQTGELISQPWTVEAIEKRALALGKPFNVNADIADKLQQDLFNGALVLFSGADVARAIKSGFVSEEDREGLLRLVEELNDIAVVPPLSDTEINRDALSARFLFQIGC